MKKILKTLPLEPAHFLDKTVKRKEIFVVTKISLDNIENINFICINFCGTQIPINACTQFLRLSFRTPTFDTLDIKNGQIYMTSNFHTYFSCFSYENLQECETHSTFPSKYPQHSKCYIINGPICSYLKDGTFKSNDILYKYQQTNDFPRKFISDKVLSFYENTQYFTTFSLHAYSQFPERLFRFRELVKIANSKVTSKNYNYNLDVFNHIKSQRAILRFTIIRKLDSDCIVVQIIGQEFFIGNGLLKYPDSGKYFNKEIHIATSAEINENLIFNTSDKDF
jgi:hypothetical protein